MSGFKVGDLVFVLNNFENWNGYVPGMNEFVSLLSEIKAIQEMDNSGYHYRLYNKDLNHWYWFPEYSIVKFISKKTEDILNEWI